MQKRVANSIAQREMSREAAYRLQREEEMGFYDADAREQGAILRMIEIELEQLRTVDSYLAYA